MDSKGNAVRHSLNTGLLRFVYAVGIAVCLVAFFSSFVAAQAHNESVQMDGGSSAAIVLPAAGVGLAAGGVDSRAIIAPLADFPLTVTPIGTGSGTVTSNPAGINCPGTCSQAFPEGTPVTLSYSANAGSSFTGWGGACGGTGDCVVNVNAATDVTAEFTRNTHVLSVSKTGNGTVTSSPSGLNCGATCTYAFDEGTLVTLTATPDPGWVLTNWGGACSGATCQVTMDAAKNVTATFTRITYNLSVTKTGSGTVTSSPSGINCGATCTYAFDEGALVTLTATPDPGWIFTSWGGACTSSPCQVSMTAIKNVTVTFTRIYNLALKKAGTGFGTVTSSPGGINCGPDCTEDYTINTTVALTAAANTGSNFSGWSECTGKGNCSVTMSASKTVTATFALNTYTLTVSKNGNGTVVSDTGGINCGTACQATYPYNTVVTLTASPAAGSSFAGWTGACAGMPNPCQVTITANTSVGASFTVNNYTLSLSKIGNGTVVSDTGGINCGTACQASYPYNTVVTLTANPAVGSSFAGWTGACTGTTNPCQVTMSEARSVSAQFTLDKHTLSVSKDGTGTGTVTSNPLGIACGSTCSALFDYGTLVSLNPVADLGSTFTGWAGACTSTGACNVTMDGAKSVTATFTRIKYSLTIIRSGTGSGTVTGTPAGINCGDTCTAFYDPGTVVTLSAAALDGSTFDGWSGAGCTGTGTCAVTLDGSKTVYATFTLKTHTLTVSKTGSGGGTVTSDIGGINCGAACQAVYGYNTAVTLSAAADATSTFTGWSGVACPGTPACQVTMVADRSVSAAFEQNTLAISDASITEGDSGSAALNFTVTLSPASGRTVTVAYATSPGTAAAGSDYTTAAGTVTFLPGELTKTIPVQVLGDLLDEEDETFNVILSNPSGAVITDNTGAGTILDNDAPPNMTISDRTVVEGNTGTVGAVFTVTLSVPSGKVVTVNYATADGTALAGSDYQGVSGALLTINPGVTRATFPVNVISDIIDEANETFTVNLSTPTNAVLTDATGAGTIQDDDTSTLSIADTSINEGTYVQLDAIITVTLSTPSSFAVTVNYATSDLTALAGVDYLSRTGPLAFAPGEVSKTIAVPVVGDTLDEINETFRVTLSTPVNATISKATATATIVDDDQPSALTINNIYVPEPASGTYPGVFTVLLTPASGRTVTVTYNTTAGTAVSGLDYQPASGTLTFAPGVTQQNLPVTVNSDVLDEDIETFFANLIYAPSAQIVTGIGTGNIIDQNGQPVLSVTDAIVVEGNAGTANLVFSVNLTPKSDKTVSVEYVTGGGTATPGVDYQAQTAPLVFAPGEVTKTVAIPVIGDLLDEANETFNVTLQNPLNADIQDNIGVGTIMDDDNPPNISISDRSVLEGNQGTVSAVFDVTLDAPSSKTITVDFTIAAGTATKNVDYNSKSGYLTFAPGVVKQTIEVLVNGDTLDEIDETFSVVLSNPQNAGITDSTGLGTILDDDGLVNLSIVPSIAIIEGNTVSVNAVFTLTLSAASSKTVRVQFATQNGTATGGSPLGKGIDYLSMNGEALFSPGEVRKTIQVPINPDTLCEAQETFFVNLSSVENANLLVAQSQATIKGDDLCSIYFPVIYDGLIYTDNFDYDKGWQEVPESNADWFLWNGKYIGKHLTVNRNAKTVAPASAASMRGSYSVKVAVQLEVGSDNGGRGGLLFDYLDNNATYRFVIIPGATSGENWLIQARNPATSEWDTLGSGRNLGLLPGNNVNVLQIDRIGSLIRAYVNGTLVWTGNNSTFSNGQVGLNIGTPIDLRPGEYVQFSFDNFTVGSLP